MNEKDQLTEQEQAELNEYRAALDEGYYAGDDLPLEQEPLPPAQE